MGGNVFVDTNVFFHLFDADDPTRQDIARSLIDRLAKEATIVVSTQVLQEFYVSVTRKLAEPLPSQHAMEATWLHPCSTRVKSSRQFDDNG